MRFMFGQAFAGAARRGSQRLKELEDRAYKVADRTTERLINKYDTWDSKVKASTTEYMNAARKLKNLSNLKLDDGQIERILAGGIEGADNFIKAYENDKRLQFTAFDKEQKNKPKLPSYMMPDETADFAIPKPEFKYNKDIFLNKMFTRSDEYLNADDKDKVNFGRDLNTQASLYAQSQNPFDAFDTLGMEARAEADQTRSLLGIGIPQEYIESTVMQQLKANGVRQPEKILGTLGENTGYAPLNYDMLDATTKAQIAANNIAERTSIANLEKIETENKYAALMNPQLLIEQNLKIEGLIDTNAYNKNRLEQSTIELNIAKLKDADWVKKEMERQKRLEELNIAAAEKALKPQTVMEAIYDFNDQLVYLQGKLKANPDDETVQRDIGVINSQMDQQFLLLARIKSAEKNERLPSTLTNYYEFQFEQARTKAGYVPAISESTDPTNALAELAVTERAHYLVPDPNNPGEMLKIYEGTAEFTQRDNNIRMSVEAGILRATGTIGGDGIWVPDDINDRGLRLLVSGFDITQQFGNNDYLEIDVGEYNELFAMNVEKLVLELRDERNANVSRSSIVKGLMNNDKGLSYTDAEQMVNSAFKILETERFDQTSEERVGATEGDTDANMISTIYDEPKTPEGKKIQSIVDKISNPDRTTRDAGINLINELRKDFGRANKKRKQLLKNSLIRKIKDAYNISDEEANKVYDKLGL